LWGQTDGVYTFFVFTAFTLLIFKKPSLASVALLLGVLHKPQALIFVPLFILAFPRNLRSIIAAVILTSLTGALILIPFALGGSWHNMTNFAYLHAYGGSKLSWNAYNLWWSLYGNKAWDMTSSQPFIWDISHGTWGFILIGFAYAIALFYARPWRSTQPTYNWERLFAAAAVIAAVFFLFGAEMHERYMFPFVAFGLPIAILYWRGAVIYVTISFLFFLNLSLVQYFSPVWNGFWGKFPSLSTMIAASLVTLILVYIVWMFQIPFLKKHRHMNGCHKSLLPLVTTNDT
jgi:Gpi18-like mannosyltransferase